MNSKFPIVQVIAVLLLLVSGCSPEISSNYPLETNNRIKEDINFEEEIAACEQIIFTYAIYDQNPLSGKIFDENIVSICPDGTDKRRLTADSNSTTPSWSPDGSKIAFFSKRSGMGQLHLMDQDGENIRQITFGSEAGGHWFWLPDGNRIAVLKTSDTGENSWQAVDVTTKVIVPLAGWSDESFYQSPVLSHDGTRLAYLALPELVGQIAGDGSPSLNQIRIQNTDGSNDFALTDDNWVNLMIAWSPDDSQIAFIAFTSDWDGADDDFAIFVVNVDGSNLHRVVDGSDLPRIIEWKYSHWPYFTWSPDGESFAIVAHGAFYILDLISGEANVLFSIEEPNYITGLSWQP